MSVAEKLKAIADRIRSYTTNTQKMTLDDMAFYVEEVYFSGYDDGNYDGYYDGWDEGYYEGYVDGYDEGEETGYENGYLMGETDGWTEGWTEGRYEGREQGKKDAYDEFWDDFQQNGNRTDYTSAFGAQWSTNTFKPKYQIKPIKAYFMWFDNGKTLNIPDFVEFADNLAKEQGKTIESNPELFDANGHYNLFDFSECTAAQYALACLHTNHHGTLNFSKCIQLSLLFYSHNWSSATSIRKIDNFISSATTKFSNDTFQHATSLTDITMSGVVANSINFGACPLNKASIESVINVLSSTATGQTVTFKKTAVNTAFGINVDDASTFTDEFNTLRNSKSNWTFSYA